MTPDYAHWSKRDLWEVKEAIQLIVGLDPLRNKEREYRQNYSAELVRQKAAYEKIAGIAETALRAGNLKPYMVWEEQKAWEYRLVRPCDFLQWAKSKDFDMPRELLPLLDGAEPEPVEEKLDTRERTTLLQIIAVLAAEAGLDLAKHSKAAETLQAMGARHELELPKKKDTIAGKLKESRDLKNTR